MKIYKYFVLIVFSLMSSGGCFLVEQSSDENLGRVEVSALLVADTCCPGTVSSGPNMRFDVELHRQGSVLTWHGPGGRYQGSLTSDNQFCIDASRGWHVRDPDPWLGDPGCDISQIERLCGTLELETADEGSLDTDQVLSLTARHELYVSPGNGSVCDELIGLSSGQYLALPCQVVYDMTGDALE